jgi:predicted HTH transcriptional regulator
MDFFFRVNSKIAKDIKVPFKLEGITRIDDTPVHKAVREALVNCIVNTDYFLPQGIVIRKESDTLTIENPGSIRTGKKQMLRGGISDPRNKNLMKMFNLIGIGERAGSGIPDIYQVWEDEGWEAPKIEERFNPDRTVLTLSFTEVADKVAKKSGEKKVAKKSGEKKVTKKTQEKYDAILKYMQPDKWYKASEFESIVGVKESRVKVLLKDMTEQGLIEGIGSTKGKMYKISK